MANIIKSIAPIASDASADVANQFAINYWGNLQNEKWFPIPFWQVGQMLAVSNSDTIALRVTNIDNPLMISAKWIVFEEALSDSLQDPVEQGVNYFILEDNTFNGPVLVSTPTTASDNTIKEFNGLLNTTLTPNNNIIRGRIGSIVTDDNKELFAFFQVAECTLIDQGGGGGGVLTGVRIKR